LDQVAGYIHVPTRYTHERTTTSLMRPTPLPLGQLTTRSYWTAIKYSYPHIYMYKHTNDHTHSHTHTHNSFNGYFPYSCW